MNPITKPKKITKQTVRWTGTKFQTNDKPITDQEARELWDAGKHDWSQGAHHEMVKLVLATDQEVVRRALQLSIRDACRKAGFQPGGYDEETIAATVKIGPEAQAHLASTHAWAYLATEGTGISHLYWESAQGHEDFLQAVQAGMAERGYDEDLIIEPYSSCEFCIYV